jgi:UDP-glucose 4-epimerase
MSLKNKSVLVTGGAGFIGSHLVDRLIQENPANLVVADDFFLGKESNLIDAKALCHDLKVFNQDASETRKMQKILEREKIEVIFNLAVIPLPTSLIRPRWVYEHNTDITMCCCELARKEVYKTLIHFSSSEAYGDLIYSPMDEKHPLNPTTTYGASKAACDHLVLAYCRSFGIDASILRPFNNYGPRQNEGSYAGVIPLTVKRIMNGDEPVIYGDGEQTRDFLYVTETAEAAVQVYNNAITRGKVLNVASGKEITINNLVRLIAQYLNYDGNINYQPGRIGDLRRLSGSVDYARKLIGFNPRASLENGLELTVRWYKKVLSG